MSEVELEFSPEIMSALTDAGVVKRNDSMKNSRIEFSDNNDLIVSGYDEEGKKIISEQLDTLRLGKAVPEPIFKEEEITDKAKSRGKIYRWITIAICVFGILLLLLFVVSLRVIGVLNVG